MQYTGNAQLDVSRSTRFRTARPLIALAAACLIALCVLVCAPTSAQAKSYTMPEVSIDATVMPNGDMHVVEKRHFSFDGSFTCVWWNFEASDVAQTDRHGYTINSVKLATYNEGEESSTKPKTLQSVPFQTSWRDEGGPGTTSWSYDKQQTSLYVFFDVYDQDMTATIDYTVKQAAIAYQDVGEIYWKYVASEWGVDSENVTCVIHPPVPVGTKITAGENLRAWGHGPLDGTVDITSAGDVVYKVGKVSSGNYGEARVVFPVEWLTELSSQAKIAHGDELGLNTILDEEAHWADEANARRIASMALIVLFIVLSLALVVFSIVMFVRHGRDPKPIFQEKYWRDVPDKNLHPAVVGRCWRYRKEEPNDLTATLMHLSAIGAIAINKGFYEVKTMFGRTKQIDEPYLTRIPAVADTLTDELDREAMRIVFDEVAGGADSLWMSQIKKYGEDNPEDFTAEVSSWQGKLTSRLNQADIFDAKGQKRTAILIVTAVFYFIIVTVFCIFNDLWFLMIPAIPTSIALLVIAHFMDSRTRKGAELQAHCEALRNWLRDFTRLDEQPPAGVKVWGEFMVYAYLFGIADEVLKQLKITMPELFEEDAMTAGGFSYMPFYWCDTSMMTSDFSAANLFSSTVSESFSTMSDSSGGGGGFSVGGGGGFGGGGGAR